MTTNEINKKFDEWLLYEVSDVQNAVPAIENQAENGPAQHIQELLNEYLQQLVVTSDGVKGLCTIAILSDIVSTVSF